MGMTTTRLVDPETREVHVIPNDQVPYYLRVRRFVPEDPSETMPVFGPADPTGRRTQHMELGLFARNLERDPGTYRVPTYEEAREDVQASEAGRLQARAERSPGIQLEAGVQGALDFLSGGLLEHALPDNEQQLWQLREEVAPEASAYGRAAAFLTPMGLSGLGAGATRAGAGMFSGSLRNPLRWLTGAGPGGASGNLGRLALQTQLRRRGVQSLAELPWKERAAVHMVTEAAAEAPFVGTGVIDLALDDNPALTAEELAFTSLAGVLGGSVLGEMTEIPTLLRSGAAASRRGARAALNPVRGGLTDEVEDFMAAGLAQRSWQRSAESLVADMSAGNIPASSFWNQMQDEFIDDMISTLSPRHRQAIEAAVVGSGVEGARRELMAIAAMATGDAGTRRMLSNSFDTLQRAAVDAGEHVDTIVQTARSIQKPFEADGAVEMLRDEYRMLTNESGEALRLGLGDVVGRIGSHLETNGMHLKLKGEFAQLARQIDSVIGDSPKNPGSAFPGGNFDGERAILDALQIKRRARELTTRAQQEGLGGRFGDKMFAQEVYRRIQGILHGSRPDRGPANYARELSSIYRTEDELAHAIWGDRLTRIQRERDLSITALSDFEENLDKMVFAANPTNISKRSSSTKKLTALFKQMVDNAHDTSDYLSLMQNLVGLQRSAEDLGDLLPTGELQNQVLRLRESLGAAIGALDKGKRAAIATGVRNRVAVLENKLSGFGAVLGLQGAPVGSIIGGFAGGPVGAGLGFLAGKAADVGVAYLTRPVGAYMRLSAWLSRLDRVREARALGKASIHRRFRNPNATNAEARAAREAARSQKSRILESLPRLAIRSEQEYQESVEDMEKIRAEIDALTTNPEMLQERLGTIDELMPANAAPLRGPIQESQIRALQVLQAAVPRPPVNPITGRDAFPPTRAEMSAFVSVVRALENPYSVLFDVATDEVDFEAVSAVRAAYPEIHSDMVGLVAEVITDLEADEIPVPDKLAVHASLLLGVPMHEQAQPSFIATMQTFGAETPAQDATINGTRSPVNRPPMSAGAHFTMSQGIVNE